MMAWLFGCPHKDYTFPLTVKRRTYVACLECGKEFNYSWQAMRVVKEVKPERKLAPVIEIGELRRRQRKWINIGSGN